MNRYSVLIRYDPIDKIFVASVPELEGCMAHGKTREDALHELDIARKLWIETAREVGIAVPEPRYVS